MAWRGSLRRPRRNRIYREPTRARATARRLRATLVIGIQVNGPTRPSSMRDCTRGLATFADGAAVVPNDDRPELPIAHRDNGFEVMFPRGAQSVRFSNVVPGAGRSAAIKKLRGGLSVEESKYRYREAGSLNGTLIMPTGPLIEVAASAMTATPRGSELGSLIWDADSFLSVRRRDDLGASRGERSRFERRDWAGLRNDSFDPLDSFDGEGESAMNIE